MNSYYENQTYESIGVILSGGKSKRFGSDKALMPFGKLKTPLIKILKEVLVQAGFNPFVSVNFPHKYRNTLELPEIIDLFPSCGPIGGITTVLKTIKAKKYLFLTCDMPFVTKEDLDRLWKHSHQTNSSSIYSFENKFRPFPCILLPDTLPILERLIQKGEFSMKRFLNDCPNLKRLDWNNESTFINMNTKQDYESIFRRFGQESNT
ncbi:MAG: molybdenum cofactor guanylyltransferase [Deltaproteobacteria bacterium]|nr:molybdenum cofactor guanylyltransferase [Deltaproteobacteria bacterium]